MPQQIIFLLQRRQVEQQHHRRVEAIRPVPALQVCVGQELKQLVRLVEGL